MTYERVLFYVGRIRVMAGVEGVWVWGEESGLRVER
jgi:hypothetical protein